MNDFERALADALKKASDDYRPTDQYAAKERFLHRLRRRQLFFATGGVALAGAAAVAGFLFFARDAAPERAEPLPPAAALDEAPAEIAVGERPSGVAFGDDHVWVANAGDGSVMVVDPASRSVVDTFEVGGDPDDVAVGVGAAWVSDSGAGTVTSLPLPSHEVESDPRTIQVGDPGSAHMDVAPGADGLWIAKDDSLFRVDPMSLEPAAINSVEGPTDVAVGEGSVYVLGTNEIARVDPETLISLTIADIPPSRNQDLAFRNGYLWIANGDAGEVTRLDPESGKFSAPIYVGGNFSGIAVDDDAVWVISGGASESGVLTRIDPHTLAVSGGRAELSGRPYDITLGAGLVWIANYSAGTVSGLHPDALPGGPNDEPDEAGDPILVFSADGDLWVESFQGHVTALVDAVDEVRNPTVSPDGSYLAFERGPDSPKDRQEVVLYDVATEQAMVIDFGWSPSFGPGNRLAYVRPTEEGDVEIVIGTVRDGRLTSAVAFEAVAGYGAPNDADHIAWDLDGDFVYYNAGWEGYGLYQAAADGTVAPFELIPSNHERFATYLAPSVRSDLSVHVLRRCCQRPGDVPRTEESLELGIIRFTEGGPAYERVVGLDPRQIPARHLSEPGLDSAGNLMLEVRNGARRWTHTVIRSWFIGTDDDIWLIDAQGRAAYVSDAMFGDLGDFSVAGLETFPDFDD